jgi:hypothetical protein
MNIFKCNICLIEFTTKQALEKHNNKKNKCNITTNYQCLKCYKYFKQKRTLIDHTTKNICNKMKNTIINSIKNDNIKIIDTIDTIVDTKITSIKSILKTEDIDENMKIELLRKFNIILKDEEFKVIFNSSMEIDDKVNLFNDYINKDNNKSNITNNNINNGTINANQTSNTTTNNIQINNFGKENIEYLDNEYFKDLIMNNHIQTAYMKLIEDTYLHKDHPENHNIKIENLNSKYGFVFENGRWRAIVKYELKELMHEKNNKLLKIHYKRLKEFLTAAKKSSINVFFSRKYDHDPHLKLMNDQMVLLFYEGKKS